MPDHIAKKCQLKVKLLEAEYKLINAKIQIAAVALGERHDDASARAVLCDLIVAGQVKKLFLELPKLEVESKLRGELLGKEIASDADWKEKEQTFTYLDRHNNPIPMKELIPLAVRHGVKVYFFDTAYLKKPASQDGMRIRNEAMGKVFAEHAKGSEPNVAVLIGASHLMPNPCGAHYQHTVQYICGIGFHNVVDLSRIVSAQKDELVA